MSCKLWLLFLHNEFDHFVKPIQHRERHPAAAFEEINQLTRTTGEGEDNSSREVSFLFVL